MLFKELRPELLPEESQGRKTNELQEIGFMKARLSSKNISGRETPYENRR